MDYFRYELERLEHGIREVLNLAATELNHLPAGALKCNSSGQHLYYFQHLHDKRGRIRKGINRKPELIAQLARKDFLLQVHAAAKENIQLLDQLIKNYHSMDPADLVRNMGNASQQLPDKSFLTSGRLTNSLIDKNTARANRLEPLRRWAREPYEQSKHKPEEKIHLTSSGIYVRSKSEALISEKLFDYNVPYRYEEVLWLDGNPYAPDFSFRDAMGEPFYWEHAGMMNDITYVRRHLNKMSVYERHGILPWKNLIVTYDTIDGAINMPYIDSIIRYQVFPRF